MSTLDDLTLRLKKMGQVAADKYLIENKDAIANSPLQDAKTLLATAYKSAFLGAQAPTPTSVITTVPKVDTGTPPPVDPNSIDPNTGLPSTKINEIRTGPSTITPLPNVVGDVTSPPAPVGFSHMDGATGVNIRFTPNKVLTGGITYNDAGKGATGKFGISAAQLKDFEAYNKTLDGEGVPLIEKQKLLQDLMKKYQEINLNSKEYGMSFGSKREDVPTDPTHAKTAVGSLEDLNNNGIPDSQEGFGVDKKTETSTSTDIKGDGTSVTLDDTYWTQAEKDWLAKDQEFTNRGIDLEEKKRLALAQIKSDNARKVIENADSRIQQINDLLDEQLTQNETMYEDAVGDVYRQLGGNVKQFQRLIGSDGKAIDDTTMLALTGDMGVTAMAKIVDLKNQLAQQYLDRKSQAQKDIYQLVKDKQITQDEANIAIQAINDQADLNILNMTKSFYEKMFSAQGAVETRTDANQVASRAAVSSYLAAIGLTPLQQTQLLNNYVEAGYSSKEAVAKLAEDIRDRKNEVIRIAEKNNQAASDAALAKFNQELQLKIDPIYAKGNVDLQLQNDEQAFKAEQAVLDRKLAATRAAGSVNKGKMLTNPQKTNQVGAAQVLGGTPANINGWTDALDLDVKVSLSNIAQGKGTAQDQSLVKAAYQITKDVDAAQATNAFIKASTPATEALTISE